MQATSGVFQKQRKTAAICCETGGKLKCLVKVISRCQWFRNGLWNVNKGEGKKKGQHNLNVTQMWPISDAIEQGNEL